MCQEIAAWTLCVCGAYLRLMLRVNQAHHTVTADNEGGMAIQYLTTQLSLSAGHLAIHPSLLEECTL